MSRLRVESSRLERLLLYLGFVVQRQKGSHVFYRYTDGRYTTISHHLGKDLPRELIRSILKQINLSTEEFLDLLKQV